MTIKVPLKKTIRDQTQREMKEMGTYNTAYNRLVDIYSGMIHEYYVALKEYEEDGSVSSVISPSGALKKHPALDQMERLRKDILAYSDRLMLNPKATDEKKGQEEKSESPLAQIFSLEAR